jgi:helix-turn-helix protein
VFVMTVDQRHSRRQQDRVDDLLGWLARVAPVVRPFERTAGDEVQGVLSDPRAVVDLTLALVRRGEWSIGIGAGPVHEPLPPSTRAGSGAAFELARAAVNRAKSSPQLLAVAAPEAAAAADAQAALDLLAAVVVRRSQLGWEATDLVAQGLSQTEVADRLGVTKQAVSQRLRAAVWAPEVAGRDLAARLLAAADQPGSPEGKAP